MVGEEKILAPGEVKLALTVLRDYKAPGALGAVYRDVVRFSRFRGAIQTMGDYLVRFDALRVGAEGRVQPGGTPPEAFAAELCLQLASLARADKSPVLASTRRSFGVVEIAQQMRRLCGPMGGS